MLLCCYRQPVKRFETKSIPYFKKMQVGEQDSSESSTLWADITPSLLNTQKIMSNGNPV